MGFALVKTCGSVGAFLGPSLIGWLADLLHGYTGAMLMLAGVAAAAAALVCGALLGNGAGRCGYRVGAPQGAKDWWGRGTQAKSALHCRQKLFGWLRVEPSAWCFA